MCGIVGIFEYGRREGQVDDLLLTRMRDTLVHRGPDEAGNFISDDRRVGLGHRRLSIIDLEHGSQPMRGRNGTNLVFNGEIYNYPSLRSELERDRTQFATNCDTEVILHLYDRYGVDCVKHLNGMFAFALWDPSEQRLFLARDRIGEKPLYWTQKDGVLIFGSEIKALLEHPLVDRQVNTDAIEPYLINLVTPNPDTLYRGIHKLPPGFSAVCDRDGLRSFGFWDLFSSRTFDRSGSFEAAVDTTRHHLERSVQARLLSDVPVGVLLSGGLDSTAIVALLRERARGLATFSVGFANQPAIDETHEARRVAAQFGTAHHEVIIGEEDAISFLTGLVHHQDEPLGDPVCIPLYFVCRLARENGVKVVMAGEGSDELFWGYPAYRRLLAQEQRIRKYLAVPRLMRRAISALVPGTVHPQIRQQLENVAASRMLPMHMPLGFSRYNADYILRPEIPRDLGWSPSHAAGPDVFETLGWDTQEYEFGLRLPELLLMRIDRFSMANSVEARVPFLDPDLVHYAYHLPFDWKLSGGETKRVLRSALQGVVPDWVLTRRKQGFGAPVIDWFGSRMDQILARLLETDSLREYFRVDAVMRLMTERWWRPGNPHAFSLWFVLNFGLWHRYWIAQESVEAITGSDVSPALSDPG